MCEQCQCVEHRGRWLHLQAFSRFYAELPPPKRLIGYSKFAEDIYSAPNLYHPGDWLMFGAETSGLPQEVTPTSLLTHVAPSHCSILACRCDSKCDSLFEHLTLPSPWPE